MIGVVEALVGLVLICVGVAFLFGWPWALIVAGALVLVDRMT